MSRIYFHTQSDTADVSGAERAHMGIFCSDIATSLLPLRSGEDRLVELLPAGNYLRTMSRTGFPDAMRWAQSYRLAFGHDDTVEWRGQALEGISFVLNTVMVVGNDEARLLARLHGQCEIHAWVDGPNRAWFADLIERARAVDLCRADMGWESVVTLLRSRDDEPAVTSYSVCDSFPNAHASDWMPAWPEGVPQQWDALPPEVQQSREEREESWYDLPDEEQWARGVAWLREQGRGLEMRPDTWDMRFGHKLSVLDLDAPDYAARLNKAVGVEAATVS